MEDLRATGLVFDRPNLQGQFRRVWGTSQDPNFIETLCQLRALEDVSVNCSNLAPDALGKLRHLYRIRELSLHGCNFHGVDLTWLEELTNLQVLALRGSSMDDAVSALPGNIPRVVTLDISSHDSSNAWISHIARLNGLERLRIFGQSNLSVDVSPLSGMPSLESLNISFRHFSGAHLPTLVPLPLLHRLDVSGANVTDRSIEVFGKFPELRHLNVSRTKISEQGLSRLRTMLLEVEVIAEHLEPNER